MFKLSLNVSYNMLNDVRGWSILEIIKRLFIYVDSNEIKICLFLIINIKKTVVLSYFKNPMIN